MRDPERRRRHIPVAGELRHPRRIVERKGPEHQAPGAEDRLGERYGVHGYRPRRHLALCARARFTAVQSDSWAGGSPAANAPVLVLLSAWSRASR